MLGERFFREKLQTLRTPIFYKTKAARVLASRLFGFRLFLNGEMSLGDALRNCLPSRFHSPATDEKFLKGIEEVADKVFSDSGLYKSPAITFFNKKFFKAGERTGFESWFHTFIMFFQCVVADQYHAKKFLKKNAVVIDVGANAGMFSVMAANISNDGRVYAFEPSPATFSILEKNIAEYPNIQAFNFALGDSAGEGDLVLARRSGSNAMEDSGLAEKNSAEKIRVKISTIDEFVKECGLERVDFIKMDTEGYEKKILEGAKETIKRFSPVLSMSAYHHAEDKREIPSLVLSLNKAYGFEITKDVEDNLLFRKRC